MKTIFISVTVATTCGLVVLIADNDSLIFILFHNNSSTIYLGLGKSSIVFPKLPHLFLKTWENKCGRFSTFFSAKTAKKWNPHLYHPYKRREAPCFLFIFLSFYWLMYNNYFNHISTNCKTVLLGIR